MRKRVVTISFIMCVLFPFIASAAILKVGRTSDGCNGPCDYYGDDGIQEAIAVVNPNDTIDVYSGTWSQPHFHPNANPAIIFIPGYKSTVPLTPITLKVADGESVTIRVNSDYYDELEERTYYANGIFAGASNWIIRGFKIAFNSEPTAPEQGYGVVANGKRVFLEHLTITGNNNTNTTAILVKMQTCYVTNCVWSDFEIGLLNNRYPYLKIADCEAYNNRINIEIYEAKECEIHRSYLHDPKIAESPAISANVLQRGGYLSRYVLNVFETQSDQVQNVLIIEGDGLDPTVRQFAFYNNIFSNPDSGNGLKIEALLEKSGFFNIKNNIFIGCDFGIWTTNPYWPHRIAHNAFYNCTTPVETNGCVDCWDNSNDVTGNLNLLELGAKPLPYYQITSNHPLGDAGIDDYFKIPDEDYSGTPRVNLQWIGIDEYVP